MGSNFFTQVLLKKLQDGQELNENDKHLISTIERLQLTELLRVNQKSSLVIPQVQSGMPFDPLHFLHTSGDIASILCCVRQYFPCQR